MLPPRGTDVPPRARRGFVAAPAAMGGGPAMEVADLICSVAIRWTAAMVARDRGKTVPDLGELEAGMRALLPLFPTPLLGAAILAAATASSLSAENRKGKEVIYDRIDGWARDLLALPGDDAPDRRPQW